MFEEGEVTVRKVSASSDVHDFSAEFPDHVLCLIWVSTERQPIYCRNTRLRLPDSELWNIWGDCSIALRDRGWLGGRSRIGMVAGKARQPDASIRLFHSEAVYERCVQHGGGPIVVRAR